MVEVGVNLGYTGWKYGIVLMEGREDNVNTLARWENSDGDKSKEQIEQCEGYFCHFSGSGGGLYRC